jgi:hypothetical protein
MVNTVPYVVHTIPYRDRNLCLLMLAPILSLKRSSCPRCSNSSRTRFLQVLLVWGYYVVGAFQSSNAIAPSVSLYARRMVGNSDYLEDANNDSGTREAQRYRSRTGRPERDRPTQALEELISLNDPSGSPKIVVLGASGKIGRRVVKKFLEIENSDDMLVVGVVRNYDKAIHVLYDDLVLAKPKKGPRLQIIEGDLVPQEDLPATSRFDDDDEEEEQWKLRAKSASSFYGNKVEDYDNRHLLPDANEALEEAIKDASIIISCVGDVRKMNLWSDAIARPFLRLLKKDVSGWCRDKSHPFYVHYATTRKALGYAEREQIRRQASLVADAEAQGVDPSNVQAPRVRFLRISDNSVAQPPWHFIPLVTNTMHSMVFRYQEMAENLLSRSELVDSVVIRPGDLVDDERVRFMLRFTLCPTIFPLTSSPLPFLSVQKS